MQFLIQSKEKWKETFLKFFLKGVQNAYLPNSNFFEFFSYEVLKTIDAIRRKIQKYLN